MKKFWLILTLTLCAAVLLSGCMGMTDDPAPGGNTPEPMMVDVMLQDAPGMTITGQNPVSVEAGGDVSFAVEIDAGYKVEALSDGATYANGVVTLQNVKYPTTVEVETRTLRDLSISLTNNSWQGTVSANVALDSLKEDTEVTLSAEPKTGMFFLGYSVGGMQVDGGVIVCTTLEYTFTVTENIELYTNYYNVGSGRLLIYDSNGGNEGLQYSVFADSSPFIGPNALANKGQFTREGHVLIGYNTEPDGSGTYYGPGWSVILPEDRSVALTLYAQWLPETEKDAFTYTVSGNQVTITKYKGDHETVVIPETIDGLPVARIAANAFINGKFKTLYLSRNLKVIDDGAFLACRSFTTLYFCDTPSSISDNSFQNCINLQKLYLLACVDPRYAVTNNGTYKLKYQRLMTAEGKKIIFHAGSNVSYGIDITTIQNELGGEYAGVNFGCNQSTPSVFFIEVATAHLNEGDIVVLCPEYHKYQYGYNEINTTTWQIFEGAYNAFADVDIRHFTSVFKSFAAFNVNRYNSAAKTYEQYNVQGGAPGVSKYGEFNINHNGQTSALKGDIAKWQTQGGYGSLKMDVNLLSQSYNENLNNAIDLVIAKGGRVYISFASTLKLSLAKDSQTSSTQRAFKNAVVKAFPKATVISDPGTFVLEESWFYNSYYHLTSAGSVHRAKLLAKDILAQFAKEN